MATITRCLKWRRDKGTLALGRSPGRPPEIAPAQHAPLVVARKISGGSRSPKGTHMRTAPASLAVI